MPTASYNKINKFVQDLGDGVHDFATDTLMIALTTTANKPVAANSTLSDLTQISYTNLSSRSLTVTSYTQTSGTANLIIADKILTASGAVAPFGVAVLYNDTPAAKPLIGWWEYGSDITMADTATFTIDFDAINGALGIS